MICMDIYAIAIVHIWFASESWTWSWFPNCSTWAGRGWPLEEVKSQRLVTGDESRNCLKLELDSDFAWDTQLQRRAANRGDGWLESSNSSGSGRGAPSRIPGPKPILSSSPSVRPFLGAPSHPFYTMNRQSSTQWFHREQPNPPQKNHTHCPAYSLMLPRSV